MRKHKRLRISQKRKAQGTFPVCFSYKMWVVNMLLLPILASVLSQYIVLWLEHWLKW